MPSITTFTLRLFVERPVTFQSFSGFAACGVFYSLVKSVDEPLAERLHSSKKLAPWSATPLFVEVPTPKIVKRILPANSIARVSFSIMDEKLSDVFKEAILKPDLSVDLVGTRARVVEVAVNTFKFSDLLSNAEPLPRKFAIEFLTPTAFRATVYDCCPKCPRYVNYLLEAKSGRRAERPCEYANPRRGVVVPLPLPALLFRNLARIWSAFSGTRAEARDVAEWAEDAIVISGYPSGIRTVRIYEHPTTNKWIVGFVGTVRFSIIDELYDEERARTAAALLKMAELTNVGVRRTAGFGMIRYMPRDETALLR